MKPQIDHIYYVDGEAFVNVNIKKLNDEYATVYHFPQVGHTVGVKEKILLVQHIHHDLYNSIVEYHCNDVTDRMAKK
jgi:hypothetical protein